MAGFGSNVPNLVSELGHGSPKDNYDEQYGLPVSKKSFFFFSEAKIIKIVNYHNINWSAVVESE